MVGARVRSRLPRERCERVAGLGSISCDSSSGHADANPQPASSGTYQPALAGSFSYARAALDTASPIRIFATQISPELDEQSSIIRPNKQAVDLNADDFIAPQAPICCSSRFGSPLVLSAPLVVCPLRELSSCESPQPPLRVFPFEPTFTSFGRNLGTMAQVSSASILL
jgi:hypothetical protein